MGVMSDRSVAWQRGKIAGTIMSKPFEDVDPRLNFPNAERDVLKFWDERKIYQQSLEQRKSAKSFVFFEGPPTANGMPHPAIA